MQSCRSITVALSPPAFLSDFAGTQEIETNGGSLAFPLDLTAASRFSLPHAELAPSHRPSSSLSIHARVQIPGLLYHVLRTGVSQDLAVLLSLPNFRDTPLTMCRRSSRHICMVQYFQGDIVPVWDFLTSRPFGFHPPAIRYVDRPKTEK